MNNEDFRRSTRDNMNEDLLRSITEGISIALASIYAANNVSAGNAANNVKREDKNMSGRSITLGTWNGNPIEWLVLKEEGLATLVISKDTIGKYYFDGNSSNNSWAHSWLRTFLNNDFYEKAFTAEEKKKIAMYAARLVVPNDFIYIDAGTTTEYLIDYLEEKNATYVTNAVTHARKLAIAGFKVILIGGELKGLTEAVVGNQAIITIDRMNFNKGFFGTNGITEKSGFTTPDINEALVKETAFNHCHFKYILADSSKFGETSAVTFGNIGEATILTDKKIGSFAKLPNIITV